MSNQSGIQASIRAFTGTAYNYEGDWHALFDLQSIPAGDFNGRLLRWINTQLGSNYDEINSAMNAYARNAGVASWNELSSLSLGPVTPYFLLLEDGSYFLLEDGVSKIQLEA